MHQFLIGLVVLTALAPLGTSLYASSLLGIRGGSSPSSTSTFSTELSASKLKLVYFDAKGAAELSRVLLKVAGMEFEDFRFAIKVKEGGGFETPEFTGISMI